MNLRAGCAAEHRGEGHVAPRKIRWVDQHPSLVVDRARRGKRDAAYLFAPTMTIDLRRRPVDQRLGGWQERRLGFDAGDEVSIRARERDSDLGSAEVDSGQHM